jgi:GNAT superfamily N-acetyltransferase
LRDTAGGERWSGWIGYDGSGTGVVAGLMITTLTDNLDKANVAVWVNPTHQRRGHGSAMAQAIISSARAADRTTLLANVAYPVGADESHPHRAFAARHGFRVANSELHRVLDLPVAESCLNRLAQQAAPHHEGYRLLEYVDDEVPPELLPSYLDLVNALMSDAPTGDVDYDAGAMTPELFHADVATMREAGRTLYRTIAVDSEGAAAAHSVLCLPGNDPGKLFQFATLVRREHRGHRLGLATKVRNLATVQARHPDRRIVHTWNAASNDHMIAVNEAMGFRVVGESAEYVRRLTD